MGTFGIGTNKLAELIKDTLDNAEGDFDRATLLLALDVCKTYQPVSAEGGIPARVLISLICCNDTPQAASMKDEADVKEAMEQMAKADWKKRHKQEASYEEYRKFCFWHIHTVDLV